MENKSSFAEHSNLKYAGSKIHENMQSFAKLYTKTPAVLGVFIEFSFKWETVLFSFCLQLLFYS